MKGRCPESRPARGGPAAAIRLARYSVCVLPQRSVLPSNAEAGIAVPAVRTHRSPTGAACSSPPGTSLGAWNRSAVATPQGAWCGSFVADRRRSLATSDKAPRRSLRQRGASVSSIVGGRGCGRPHKLHDRMGFRGFPKPPAMVDSVAGASPLTPPVGANVRRDDGGRMARILLA